MLDMHEDINVHDTHVYVGILTESFMLNKAAFEEYNFNLI